MNFSLITLVRRIEVLNYAVGVNKNYRMAVSSPPRFKAAIKE